MKGLPVSIIGTDCTNGGVTSGKTRAILIGDGIPELSSPSEDCPALFLEYDLNPEGIQLGQLAVGKREWLREILDSWAGINNRAVNFVVRPSSEVTKGRWTMFGGNYVTTSDSRFPAYGPLKVFDRIE